jgi:hypothetical protein
MKRHIYKRPRVQLHGKVKVQELAAQIHEARTLRHQAVEEAEALLRSIISHTMNKL